MVTMFHLLVDMLLLIPQDHRSLLKALAIAVIGLLPLLALFAIGIVVSHGLIPTLLLVSVPLSLGSVVYIRDKRYLKAHRRNRGTARL